MRTIIQLLQAQCLPYFNQHYKCVLESTNQPEGCVRGLRNLWGVTALLQAAKNTHDILAWLHALEALGNSEEEQALKAECLLQAQACFEQCLCREWPDSHDYEQIRKVIYKSSKRMTP